MYSAEENIVSLAPSATHNFISACLAEFLVSFVRYACLKYLPFRVSESNNIFPYPLLKAEIVEHFKIQKLLGFLVFCSFIFTNVYVQETPRNQRDSCYCSKVLELRDNSVEIST